MSDPKQYRTKEEWFKLIQECRKSGLSDSQWCSLNGINRYSFNTAIKRLRKCSYAIPSHSSDDIHDLTLPRQDVVKVDIIPDIQPQQELVPAATPHLRGWGIFVGKALVPINIIVVMAQPTEIFCAYYLKGSKASLS